MVEPKLYRQILWSEKRDLIRELLKSLEETEVLLPTTNADIEYGRWLEREEQKNAGT